MCAHQHWRVRQSCDLLKPPLTQCQCVCNFFNRCHPLQLDKHSNTWIKQRQLLLASGGLAIWSIPGGRLHNWHGLKKKKATLALIFWVPRTSTHIFGGVNIRYADIEKHFQQQRLFIKTSCDFVTDVNAPLHTYFQLVLKTCICFLAKGSEQIGTTLMSVCVVVSMELILA